MRRYLFAALLALAALPANAGTVPQSPQIARDETARLAVAVLGRVCLMALGDLNAARQISAPDGEFGFVEPPADVAASFLGERQGFVRVLRRPGIGAVVLVAGQDGICSVWSEWADGEAVQRHLTAMVDKGGFRGAGQLVALGSIPGKGEVVSEFYFLPADWYARALGKRFGDDGARPVLLTTSVSPAGTRPMEAVLSVARRN
jgi:hypothetical protein